jgi:muramoyltetrapeptide carboxypeptidase
MTGSAAKSESPTDAAALLPPRLSIGDRARLILPASFPTAEWVEETRHILEDWGLVVDVGRHAMDQWGFMAGRDQDRLDDLNEAFRDPGVRAVIAIVGGAGAYRIAPHIDFAAVRADPQPLIGFSDITSLHVARWRNCRLATIHGCLAGDDAVRTARQLLMTTEPITVRSEPALSAGISVPGRAAGPLIGGSLSTFCHAVGTGMPSLRGAILLFEDFRGMGLGRVDRQLTQLINSGTLDGVAGIALGLFTAF